MPADDEALFKKGMPIRRAVLGAEYVDASMAKADDFMMSFQRATTTWAWGWAWGDDTLPRKTRSLLNLAMLTALGRTPEIKLHVKGALNNGISVEEIKATLLHATAYCGIPAGLDAFKAAHEVLLAEGAIKPKEAAAEKAPKAPKKPKAKK
ncbi:carboxymuconolactone decarboxylase family protein [Roseococcus sp.]|uniref:carboxymuconolactone decarboxylase family protein n=1 Tax=Roseococcus sp. TaxID=2109646 RepID=UPI003BAC8397